MTIKTVIFDAYGTLLDVDAAARAAAEDPETAGLTAVWPRLSALWRQKQLQYTWLRTIAGQHTDFWQITQDSLDWAMEAVALNDAPMRERLLALYRVLAPYPEAPGVLGELKAEGYATGILSNGSPEMLGDAVAAAGIGGDLDAVLSVETVGHFKPDARVYGLVGQHFETAPDEVLFVSSNGWDAAGAAAFGFITIWVNRAGDPIDRLPGRPDHVVTDLSSVPRLLRAA